MAHLKKSIFVNAPVEEVYAFARDPKRWATWYIGLSEPKSQTGEGEAGTVIEHALLMAGVEFALKTTVLEDHISSEGARWRGQGEGAFAAEQTWTYTPKDNGTEVTADVEYTVPGRALGKVADRLLIERMNANGLEQTLENLKLLCEAG